MGAVNMNYQYTWVMSIAALALFECIDLWFPPGLFKKVILSIVFTSLLFFFLYLIIQIGWLLTVASCLLVPILLVLNIYYLKRKSKKR